jgi:hypothetical protein
MLLPFHIPVRRLWISALCSLGLVIAWGSANVLSDHCWLFIKGIRYVVFVGSVSFVWLFFLFALQWSSRILLLIASVLLAILMPSIELNTLGAAESGAAVILRNSNIKLEESRRSSGHYPVAFAFDREALPDRFYQFEYIPVASPKSGLIESYLLRARPIRYGCGAMPSFTVSRQGEFHLTRENREATLDDPTLE